MDVRRHRPPLLLAALAAVVVAGFVVLGADPASAHDTLRSSNPADDEHLAAAPDRVVLRFGGHPLEMGATVVVADADGEDWVAEAATVDGQEVGAPLADGMGDGYYQIRWRVVSADGAVISGTVDFSVGDLTGAEPVRVSSSSATETQGAGDFAGQAGVAAAATTSSGDDDTSGRPPLLVGAFGAVAALALALGYQRFVGGRIPSPEPTPTQEHP